MLAVELDIVQWFELEFYLTGSYRELPMFYIVTTIHFIQILLPHYLAFRYSASHVELV